MRRIFNISALFVLALANLTAPAPEVAGAELTGTSRVISGDTLEVAGREVRLYGVDAPEPGQRCRLAGGRIYDCGHVAATALMDLTVAATVTCRQWPGEIGGIPVAICFAGGYDLSHGMVHTGWALALPVRGTVYAAVQEQAQKARRGMWRGDFIQPWKWREGRRLGQGAK